MKLSTLMAVLIHLCSCAYQNPPASKNQTFEGDVKQKLIGLTQDLLDSISAVDFSKYSALTDPSLTAFEPETMGHFVSGMEFHKFFFDNTPPNPKSTKTVRSVIVDPKVHLFGDSAACVAYVRLVETVDKTGNVKIQEYQETRVWKKRAERWLMVHLHRSGGRSSN